VVSYVVNRGPKKVSPATEQRVLAAVAQTGYLPDPVAQALASGHSRTIGLIVPDITNPFFARLARQIQVAAGDQTVLLLGDSAGDERRERTLLASQAASKVAAIILGAATDTPDLSAVLPAAVPVVVVDRGAAVEGPRVTVDHRAGALAACEHLIWHGHKTLACLAGPAGISSADLRVDGWREACRRAGIEAGPLVRADFSRRGGYLAAKELLALPGSHHAVFVSDDQQAVGFLRAAAEVSLDVPGQCAIVTFDGTEDAAYVNPPLTTVAQPVPQIAEEVMKLVAANLRALGGANVGSRASSQADSSAVGNADSNADGNAGRRADRNADGDANGDASGNADSEAKRNADGNAGRGADRNADGDADSDADGSADSSPDRSADSRADRRIDASVVLSCELEVRRSCGCANP
jgi:LacI family transcriptional regulator